MNANSGMLNNTDFPKTKISKHYFVNISWKKLKLPNSSDDNVNSIHIYINPMIEEVNPCSKSNRTIDYTMVIFWTPWQVHWFCFLLALLLILLVLLQHPF